MKHDACTAREGDYEIVTLSNEYITAKICPAIGNTLFSLQFNSRETIYFPFTLETYANEKRLAGNPFMHPWANRLEGNFITVEGSILEFTGEHSRQLYRDSNLLPLHGLLLKTDKWKTLGLQQSATASTHTAELKFDDEIWLQFFPFRHSIKIIHSLSEKALFIETVIENDSNEPMPVSFGFHPYFSIEGMERSTLELTIPAGEVMETNDFQIPTGKGIKKEEIWNFNNDSIRLADHSFDHGFQKLHYSEGSAEFRLNDIAVRFLAGYPVAQVYAPSQSDKPYVCIEPMTAATNALNSNKCPMIAPGDTFSAAFAIDFAG